SDLTLCHLLLTTINYYIFNLIVLFIRSSYRKCIREHLSPKLLLVFDFIQAISILILYIIYTHYPKLVSERSVHCDVQWLSQLIHSLLVSKKLLWSDQHARGVKYIQMYQSLNMSLMIFIFGFHRCRNITYPLNLPQVSVVFIFVNEALSVILRSIHSAVNRTPSHLLKEIILVDDNSNNSELKEKLQDFVSETNSQHPGFIKMVRHAKQEGLIRSRVSGWRAATAPVVALFDAHVEFNAGWAEPILQRIKEDRTRIISPSFDNIKYDTFEIEEYPLSAQGFDWELWCRYLNPPKLWWHKGNKTAPIQSPALIGCFVVDRLYFEEIGLLDEGMEVYGGENVELGIRVWQCGGSVEVLPCSRTAHIERAHKPYTEDLTSHVRRNALRVAEVWMDEFKSHVYMAWNIPLEDSGIDIGNISERKALRKRLQCKTFRWYLVNIYPEMRMYSDTIAYGVLKNSLKKDLCLDQGPDNDNVPILYLCHGMTPQNVYYTSTQHLHIGLLSPTMDDDDNKCLVDVNSRPCLIECSYAAAKRMKLHWLFTQGGSIQNKKSKRCLELVASSDNEFGYQLALQKCTGQKWFITNITLFRYGK
uniref:Polypeptide N-acetylgalactosaminyltransferase n=1 Tax=Gouania willdenowi TaxID=441366 RepID=A0A8C5N892_GOUWI